jgi:hypothetical protein
VGSSWSPDLHQGTQNWEHNFSDTQTTAVDDDDEEEDDSM